MRTDWILDIEAFDQLRHLENYLIDEKSHGKKMSELYELVQYAGNVLPRLFVPTFFLKNNWKKNWENSKEISAYNSVVSFAIWPYKTTSAMSFVILQAKKIRKIVKIT